MKLPAYRILVGFLIAVLTALAFQNCGSGESDSTTSPQEKLKTYEANAPFAFDVNVNQITYMSCADNKAQLSNKNVFFTFKVGAFDSFGVRITPELVAYTHKNLDAPYSPNSTIPKGDASPDQIQYMAQNSAESKGAQLQLAIRNRNNLVDGLPVLRSNGSDFTPQVNLEYAPILDPLQNEAFIIQMMKNLSGRTNYFPTVKNSLSQSRLEGTLYLHDSLDAASKIRNGLRTDNYLALTYTKDQTDVATRGQPYQARGPTQQKTIDSTKVYGVGFSMDFKSGNASTSYQHNILSGISEYDLLTKNPVGSQWDCSRTALKIIDPADERTQCPDEITGINVNELKIYRRHLPEESWKINLALHCAVPREGNCYAKGPPSLGVEYDTNVACGAVEHQPKDCVEYISICTRN